MDDVLGKLLKAKDERAEEREKISRSGKASVSLNLNVPGYPKSDKKLHHLYKHVLSELKRYLTSYRIFIDTNKELDITDEAGDFFLVPILNSDLSITDIKQIAEGFESNHHLGRLLDVDITDKNGNPVSSGKVKQCYFCKENPALVCMRKKSHSYVDMRNQIERDVDNYFTEVRGKVLCKKLATTALRALLYEVSLSPKPGLVDRISNGSHSDMDYISFIDSASVISVYFKDIAEFGYNYSSKNIKNALPELRKIGLQMEEDMFAITQGVNTHKGAIFLLGFSIFVGANLLSKRNFNYQSFISLIKELNGDLVEKELGKNLYVDKMTHGEKCFEKYGLLGRGIRGEIQAGLPCVFHHAIPVLRGHLEEENQANDKLINRALTHALLALIANNDDSNILFRKGADTLEKLKYKAQIAFESFDTPNFERLYQNLINYCESNYISPGGSADLLSIAYFIFEINQFTDVKE